LVQVFNQHNQELFSVTLNANLKRIPFPAYFRYQHDYAQGQNLFHAFNMLLENSLDVGFKNAEAAKMWVLEHLLDLRSLGKNPAGELCL